MRRFACEVCEAEFDAAAARGACGDCASAGGCGRIRCPYCGHESVPLPAAEDGGRPLRGLIPATRRNP